MGQVSLSNSIKTVWRNDGPLGFYKGWMPNFTGSITFRSIQFSAFETAMTYWEHSDTMRKKIPFLGDMEYRVIAAGLFAGSCRSIVECPFQYSKTRRQTG